jgi:hypothetical protein
MIQLEEKLKRTVETIEHRPSIFEKLLNEVLQCERCNQICQDSFYKQVLKSSNFCIAINRNRPLSSQRTFFFAKLIGASLKNSVVHGKNNLHKFCEKSSKNV